METSLDFSAKNDLIPLARLVALIREATPGRQFMLAGAQARDLLLKYGYGIDTGRNTADIDFAFRMDSWDDFNAFRGALLASKKFTAVPNKIHKLRFNGILELDIIPFGGIERDDRTIAWPPEHAFVLSLFGFREAMERAIDVLLPERQAINAPVPIFWGTTLPQS